jgi:HrpA-like RNA helicase
VSTIVETYLRDLVRRHWGKKGAREADVVLTNHVISIVGDLLAVSTTTPAVADGRLPLLMHLLSPACRPLQVTRDLVGFWTNGYAEVGKELRCRYSKHP